MDSAAPITMYMMKKQAKCDYGLQKHLITRVELACPRQPRLSLSDHDTTRSGPPLWIPLRCETAEKLNCTIVILMNVWAISSSPTLVDELVDMAIAHTVQHVNRSIHLCIRSNYECCKARKASSNMFCPTRLS
eukprot:scaffold327986_cov18-Prasinocladus_malaysianus.AAC.1